MRGWTEAEIGRKLATSRQTVSDVIVNAKKGINSQIGIPDPPQIGDVWNFATLTSQGKSAKFWVMPQVRKQRAVPTSLLSRYTQCCSCFYCESLDFLGTKLIPTTRFTQDGNSENVYHSCTSGFWSPCRVFPAFLPAEPITWKGD